MIDFERRPLDVWQPAIGPLTYQWPDRARRLSNVGSEIKAGHPAFSVKPHQMTGDPVRKEWAAWGRKKFGFRCRSGRREHCSTGQLPEFLANRPLELSDQWR
jgi:hypothetical protein